MYTKTQHFEGARASCLALSLFRNILCMGEKGLFFDEKEFFEVCCF